jgi:hypothetical protein
MSRRLCVLTSVVCLSIALHVNAVPPPTEYTTEMLEQDLAQAHLVALSEVLEIDTVENGLEQTEHVHLRILKCYKGGIAVEDSVIATIRSLNLVGGYSQTYEVGLQSIVCYYDGAGDGVHLTVNARGKFDLAGTDSILPPPVGYGFGDDLDLYSGSLSLFEELLEETIRRREFVQFMPVLPYEDDEISLKSAIDVSGGAELLFAAVDVQESLNLIHLYLTYLPCTSQACPSLYLIVDTTVSVGTLTPGRYTAYRYEINYLINEPTGISAPTDSVRFTVYSSTATRRNAVVFADRSRRLQAGHSSACPRPTVCFYLREPQTVRVDAFGVDGRRVWAPGPSRHLDAGLTRLSLDRGGPAGAVVVLRVRGKRFDEVLRAPVIR